MGSIVSKIFNDTPWILICIDAGEHDLDSIFWNSNCHVLFHEDTFPPLINCCSGSHWNDVIADEFDRLLQMRNPA